MSGHKRSKINQLLKKLPRGCVATQQWLSKQGIYRQLAEVYCKSGWFKKIGHGAYIREGDDISWMGGLYAIQRHMELPIHLGGKTALEHQGLAHFLPVAGQAGIFLFGNPPSKLPKWFKNYDWGVKINYSTPKLFSLVDEIGLAQENIGQYAITISAPERAIIEFLYFVPAKESFENAKLLMEGLTTLRPDLIQTLLEKCQYVKTKRLFLFLAEECGHNWVHDLDVSRVSLGGGKRVIVRGGKIDPKYGITVLDEPFTDSTRQETELRNKKSKSIAVRLMCPERGKPLSYDKEHGLFGAIVFLAFKRGKLPILNQLLKKFNIEKRGSKSFKNRLREDWLEKVPQGNLEKIRKGANNTLAALVELVVAKYLKEHGSKILDLEAWNNNSNKKVPDILYREDGQERNVEVKYVDDSPEEREMIVKQIKTGKPEARNMDERALFNYYFGRIVQAVIQLECYPMTTRQVWIVFSPHADRDVFERNYLKNPPNWFLNTDEQKVILNMISKKARKDISVQPPSEWFKKIPEIVLSTLSSPWSLEKVKKYRTKDLVNEKE